MYAEVAESVDASDSKSGGNRADIPIKGDIQRIIFFPVKNIGTILGPNTVPYSAVQGPVVFCHRALNKKKACGQTCSFVIF